MAKVLVQMLYPTSLGQPMRLIDPQVFDQNRHHLTRSPRWNRFAPVVGFGIAYFVQAFDVELDGGKGVKQQMPNGFARSPAIRIGGYRIWGTGVPESVN